MSIENQLSDIELIRRLKNDDRKVFTEIYKRYAASLAGFAASKLYNLEDARDILHDLFVKLWEERSSIIITGSLESYLYAAIRYRIIDKIRRNVTRQKYDVMLEELSSLYAPGIEEHIDAKELQQLLDRSLENLPPRTKEIYLLSRNKHLTVTEIAGQLGLSEQTVKNQLTTALKHLRQSMPLVGIATILLHWLK
jgi:RNA polymerase sigma-70 factor (family 1)